MNKRRLVSITIVGCVYVCVGCISIVGAVYRFLNSAVAAGAPAAAEAGAGAVASARQEALDLALALLSSFIAITAGAFVLRGANWARWLCVAWMAAHVVLSMFHPLDKLIIHGLLLVVVTYLLFRPAAGESFR